MKEYQPKSSKLSHTAYMLTVYFIRGHDERQAEYASVIGIGSVPQDVMLHGTIKSDPTALQAEKLIKLGKKIDAVERALQRIPEEYRNGVYSSIAYRTPYPDYANKNTWTRWRISFITYVAEAMEFI